MNIHIINLEIEIYELIKKNPEVFDKSAILKLTTGKEPDKLQAIFNLEKQNRIRYLASKKGYMYNLVLDFIDHQPEGSIIVIQNLT